MVTIDLARDETRLFPSVISERNLKIRTMIRTEFDVPFTFLHLCMGLLLPSKAESIEWILQSKWGIVTRFLCLSFML